MHPLMRAGRETSSREAETDKRLYLLDLGEPTSGNLPRWENGQKMGNWERQYTSWQAKQIPPNPKLD